VNLRKAKDGSATEKKDAKVPSKKKVVVIIKTTIPTGTYGCWSLFRKTSNSPTIQAISKSKDMIARGPAADGTILVLNTKGFTFKGSSLENKKRPHPGVTKPIKQKSVETPITTIIA
jgi:hypothetical protein